MRLLPVHDQQIAEDEASEVGEMRDAAADTGNSSKELDSTEYEHEPLGLHIYRRKYQPHPDIRIKHRESHENAVNST